jgi:hypothetical protein
MSLNFSYKLLERESFASYLCRTEFDWQRDLRDPLRLLGLNDKTVLLSFASDKCCCLRLARGYSKPLLQNTLCKSKISTIANLAKIIDISIRDIQYTDVAVSRLFFISKDWDYYYSK